MTGQQPRGQEQAPHAERPPRLATPPASPRPTGASPFLGPALDRALPAMERDLRAHLDALTRDTQLLTPAEHRVMDLTAEVWNTLCRDVVGADQSRGGDLAEIAAHVHAIQDKVLAQAAARAYPDRYRLLGGVLPDRIEEAPSG